METKLKTLTFRLIVPDEGGGPENVWDIALDLLYEGTEGVEILADERDATEEECEAYRRRGEDDGE